MAYADERSIMAALPGERARLNTARWVLWGNVLLGALAVTLHIFAHWFIDQDALIWAYLLPSLGICVAALLSLHWLHRSLAQAMLLFTLIATVCVSVILVRELEAETGVHVLVIALFHVGIFALGLILGFRAALAYATLVATILIVLGLVYSRGDEVVLSVALAYVVALPARVVEQLIQESTAELANINLRLQNQIAERKRAEEALQEHREQLEQTVEERTFKLMTANEQLQTEISERTRTQEALRQRTTELETRNEELDAFAHTVAHDLKNPLNAIIGYAEMVAEGLETQPVESLQKDLHNIARTGRKMTNIIEELILLAGVREMEVEMKPLDTGRIVAEVQQRLADMIEHHQAQISLPPEGDWPLALGYAPWVEEVWVNYLSNALKYGGQPPHMELGAAETADGAIHFWVRDDGPGLTPTERARLFTPFTQLHQVRAKGHGLGLSIVRRIVEKLGGRAWVESQVGQGSTFFFTLPNAANATPPKAKVSS